MVEPEAVRQIARVTRQGWGHKRVAAELGIAPNTVRRYVQRGEATEVQARPGRGDSTTPGEPRRCCCSKGRRRGMRSRVRRPLRERAVAASEHTI
jgi:IS30 family transposase